MHDGHSEASAIDCVTCDGFKHAAIVHAWIPRAQVPVVEGEVQG